MVVNWRNFPAISTGNFPEIFEKIVINFRKFLQSLTVYRASIYTLVALGVKNL